MAIVYLKLKTWIPYRMIGNPLDGFTYFGGDNRGEDWDGKYRTFQYFTVDTSKLQIASYYKDVGTTYKYRLLDDKLVGQKKASNSGLTYSTYKKDGALFIHCKCSIGNPLVPGSPNIDYDFTIKITSLGSVRITGSHDGFPGYEFWRKIGSRNPELIWSHNPTDTGELLWSLAPPMEHTDVNKGKSA